MTLSQAMPRVGERVEGYVARVGLLREFKTPQSAFYLFKAVTAAGSLGCVVWNSQVGFKAGDYVKLWGEVKVHKEAPQLAVHRYEVLPPENFQADDFAASSQRSPEAMRQELEEAIGRLVDPALRRILAKLLLEDPRSATAFARAPAAKTHHHPFLGGLLEHSLSVARRAVAMILPDDRVDPDLVLAGALLHDLGKIAEYAYQGPEIGYTEAGNMLGHVVLGYGMVRQAIDEDGGLAPEKATHLLHILLSHQGRLEYGSPVEPRSAEAFFVHHADTVDAHLFQVRRTGEDFPDSRMGYARSLNRMVLANPQLPADSADRP